MKLLDLLTYRPESDSFVDSSGRVVDTDSWEFVSLNAKYEKRLRMQGQAECALHVLLDGPKQWFDLADELGVCPWERGRS